MERLDTDIVIVTEPKNAEHAEEISAISRVCFSDPWSSDAVAETLRAEQNLVLTARNTEGLAVGFAMASVAADSADILDIAVTREYRQRGIGRALLSSLLSKLKGMGVAQVYLEVRASNTIAAALYTSEGFVPCGVRRNYYSSPKEDAALYTADLSLRL